MRQGRTGTSSDYGRIPALLAGDKGRGEQGRSQGTYVYVTDTNDGGRSRVADGSFAKIKIKL